MPLCKEDDKLLPRAGFEPERPALLASDWACPNLPRRLKIWGFWKIGRDLLLELSPFPPYNGMNEGAKQRQKGMRSMATTRETIEVTAGEVAAELKRRGIGSDEKVTLTIEAENEIFPGRRASRARVVAAGYSDEISIG